MYFLSKNWVLKRKYHEIRSWKATGFVPEEGGPQVNGDAGEPDHEEAKSHTLRAVL